jgi:hypothetical protein
MANVNQRASAVEGAAPKKANLQRRDTDVVALRVGVPKALAEPTLVTYRSVGIGVFGVVMRFAGMPLEKIALYMNSSQISGKNPFRQAVSLTFKDGMLAPYRVVGPASMVAWFLQYSVMGMAFQFFDHSLSAMMGVKPVYYGSELMLPPVEEQQPMDYQAKFAFKTLLSPILAACLESKVSNRAEVQRYFGREKFAMIESALKANPVARAAGPAYAPNVMRNVIMCQTTFLLTPITYKLYFPQERKSKTSLFWYGLSMNIFAGNVLAITQQSLWGRSLDYLANNGQIRYRNIIAEGLRKDGISAFFTVPKWGSRVLMNAPAQGVLPWFYNEILPLGENVVLTAVKNLIYEPFLKESEEMQLLRRFETRLQSAEVKYTATSPNPQR